MQVKQITFDNIVQTSNSPQESIVKPTSSMLRLMEAAKDNSVPMEKSDHENVVSSPTMVAQVSPVNPENTSIEETKFPSSETTEKKPLSQKKDEKHILIDGKTNEEAIQALIEHLDASKEVQDTSDMRAINLAPGLFVSYTISGSSFATSRENENDYIEKIKMALPKELRGASSRLRNVIDRELDNYSIKVFSNLRYVPAKNFVAVQKLLVDAKSKGVGKDNKYSIENIIDDLWENRDTINQTAEELGIKARVEDLPSLKEKICLTTLFIDTSFGNSTLDPKLVDQVIETKTKQVVDQINTNLTSNLQDIISNISKSLAKAKNTKTGKPNGKSITSLQKEIARIRSLNLTSNTEISTLLDAADGLILRSLEEATPITSSRKTVQSRNKSTRKIKSSNQTTTDLSFSTEESVLNPVEIHTPMEPNSKEKSEKKDMPREKKNFSFEDLYLESM